MYFSSKMTPNDAASNIWHALGAGRVLHQRGEGLLLVAQVQHPPAGHDGGKAAHI